MKLHDPSFINFNGEPVTGRVPPTVLIANDVEPTAQQLAGVVHAYKLFCDVKRVSIPGYLTQHRELMDGTRIRMMSNNGVDSVVVWPASSGGGHRYVLHPAFWYNAPLTTQPMPAEIHSGTWVNAPIKADGTGTKAIDKFWKVHPGNRTWRDSRPDAPSKGLVLSWWGVGHDRYTDWVHPRTAIEPAFNKLYCNGTLIFETDPSFGVAGACIRQDTDNTGAKTLKLVVAVIYVQSLSSYYQKKTVRYGISGAFDPYDSYSGHIGGSMTVNWYVADMPGSFRDGRFKKLTFSLVGSQALGVNAGTFTVDGVQYIFGQSNRPFFHASSGIVMNASGTEGFLRVAAGQIWQADNVYKRTVLGLKFDTTTGRTTSAVYGNGINGSGDGNTDVMATWPILAADYEDDELVYVAYRYEFDTGRKHVWHSKYGHLVDATNNSSFVVGDLRVGWMRVVQSGGTAYTFNKGVQVGTESAASIGTSSTICDGFEGCDSSFDKRLLVERFNGAAKVYIDGTDVTAALDDPNKANIKYPVLCGPMQFPPGKHDKINDLMKYVTGATP